MNAIQPTSNRTFVALLQLAADQYAAGNWDQAVATNQHILSLDPGNPMVLTDIGTIYWEQGKYQSSADILNEAILNYKKVISRSPVPVEPFEIGLAATYNKLGRVEEAIAVYRRAKKLWPASTAANFNFAGALLTSGRLSEAWPYFEARFKTKRSDVAERLFSQIRQERWTGKPLRNQAVMVLGEGGYGDVIQFSRYLPMVAAAGGTVIVSVQRALMRLLGQIPGVLMTVSREQPGLPPFDTYVPMLSLPGIFNTDLGTVPPTPYIRGNPEPWRDFLSGMRGLRVGLVWAGGDRPGQPFCVLIDRRRSMRLVDMAPLLDVPGCSFVSLQIGPPAAQLRDYADRVSDVADRIGDWQDTADLVAGLDVVITVDTAVAHLAGAMGKPVWLLNRYDTCWRWMLNRADSPWYNSMRIFRQTRPGEWGPVITMVQDALREVAAA